MKLQYTLFLFALLCACKSQPQKEIVELTALRASAIYRYDSVTNYLTKYGNNNKTIAESYYERGLEATESNPKKAIYFVKRAITLHPTLEAYKKLGKLLIESKLYNEAGTLYYFITNRYNGKNNDAYAFEAPDIDIYCDQILAQYLSNNYIDVEAIWRAEESGVNTHEIKDRLLKTGHFNFDTASVEYKNFVLKFLNEAEIEQYKNSPETFKSLVASIADTAADFKIDEKKVQEFSYHEQEFWGPEGVDLSDLYIHYLKEKRDDPEKYLTYNLERTIAINDSVLAVIYSIDQSATACPKEMRHIYHRLVTYSKSGNILDSEIVARQEGEILSTVEFSKKSFVITNYKRTWRTPYTLGEFDNEILKTEPTDVKAFSILPNGQIEPTSI